MSSLAMMVMEASGADSMGSSGDAGLEYIVLYTAADNKDDFVIQILVVSCKDEEIVNKDDHPFKEIFENCSHDLLESETSNGDTLLHEG